MDWSKVDPALAVELVDATGGDEEAQRRMAVFVYLDVARADSDLLAEMGVEAPESGGIGTGTVSADDVRRLTDQPWVTRVRLSVPLQFMGDG